MLRPCPRNAGKDKFCVKFKQGAVCFDETSGIRRLRQCFPVALFYGAHHARHELEATGRRFNTDAAPLALVAQRGSQFLKGHGTLPLKHILNTTNIYQCTAAQPLRIFFEPRLHARFA